MYGDTLPVRIRQQSRDRQLGNPPRIREEPQITETLERIDRETESHSHKVGLVSDQREQVLAIDVAKEISSIEEKTGHHDESSEHQLPAEDPH